MSTYLKRVSARGLKSGDFSHEIEQVNLFTGRSFTGKTSRLDAINIALLGFNPSLGKQAQSTLTLARNGSLTVEIEDSLGRINRRSFGKKTESKCLIPDVPEILISSASYFELSDAKKVQYVFSLYPMEDHKEFSAQAIIKAASCVRPEMTTEHTLEWAKSHASILAASNQRRIEEGKPIQQWLTSLVESAKEKLKFTKATADRMTKSVQAMTQITATDAATSDVTDELRQKKLKLGELQGQIGSLEQSLKTYRATLNRKMAMETELPDEVTVPDNAGQITKIQGEIEELERETFKNLQAQIAELTSEIGLLKASDVPYLSQTAKLQEAYYQARFDVDQLEEKARLCASEESSLVDRLVVRLERPCCPECGASGPEMEGRIMAAHEQAISDLLKRNEEIKSKLEAATIQRTDAGKAVENSMLVDKQIEQQAGVIRQKEKDLQKLNEKLYIEERGKHASITKKRNEIALLQEITQKAEQANKQRNETLCKISALEIELRGTESTTTQTNLDALKLDKTALYAEILKLEEHQKAFEKEKLDGQRNAQALLEHGKAKAEVEMLKLAIEALETIQARMVEAAFGKILETVNAVCAGILKSPVEYRDGVLGRWAHITKWVALVGDDVIYAEDNDLRRGYRAAGKEKVWVSHETFSGTEKALTYAGISLALAKDSAIKILMIDELGRLDLASLRLFMRRMVELVREGVISQFCGAYSGSYSMDGVNVIDLSAPEKVTEIVEQNAELQAA